MLPIRPLHSAPWLPPFAGSMLAALMLAALMLPTLVGCSTPASPPPAPPAPPPRIAIDPGPEVVAAPAPIAAPTRAPAPPGARAEFDVAALRQRNAPQQRQTAPAEQRDMGIKLQPKWMAQVGRTTFRTTMALVGGELFIGTHGATLDGVDELEDRVYVIAAATGTIRRTIKPPGTGDLDVGGVAVAGQTLYFTTDNGYVVATDLQGKELWKAQMKGKVRPAPALGDLNGDGHVDVVAGDEHGRLGAFDGRTGARLWLATTGTNDYGNQGFLGGAALADLDGDGRDDVIAGGRDSVLTAYRGRDGKVLWQVKHSSGIHSSPSVMDLDGDGRIEVLAAWSYGDLLVLDGKAGQELWGLELSLDKGGIEGLFSSPIPLPGSPGVIIQGTSWWGNADGVVGVGPLKREFKAFEGRVTASAVVTDLNGDGSQEAIIGTERGLVLAFDARGGRQQLTRVGAPIEATAMVADTDGNGTFELLVAANDGMLRCFETGSRAQPFVARFRGNSNHNRGDLGLVKLSWGAAATTAVPKTHPGTSGGGIRIDYLNCCTALQQAATRAPAPRNRALLRAAAACNDAAAAGKDRDEMLKAVRPLVGGTLPHDCAPGPDLSW
ncbi:MAG: PQQ-like beta-propeller repeat protein [Deltaproteobacteria bacterium]|nr:PQQ-like beta-propeller repeat protein [Deltaproteobacteria bacterium]